MKYQLLAAGRSLFGLPLPRHGLTRLTLPGLAVSCLYLPGLLLWPASAGAALNTPCDSPSAQLQQAGELYTDPQPDKAIAAETVAWLNDFYARLQGQWSGELTDRYCLGSGDSVRLRVRNYLLKDTSARIEHEGLLIFRGEKHRLEHASAERRHRTLYSDPDNRMDFLPASALSGLTVLDANTVALSARFRQGILQHDEESGVALPARSRLRERQDILSLHGEVLEIETRYFSNGYFTGSETLRLTRR